MEHWAFNETILQTISQISSGNTIPDETLLQIKDHRRRAKIEETMRRTFMGQLEFELFSPMDETVVSLQRRLSQRFTPHELLPKSDLTPILQLIEANRSNPVSQYRYLVSEVISADIFQGFQEAGMSNQDEMRNLGLLFYEHLLKPGPLVDGKKAIKLLRGRDHVKTTAYCSMYEI
jgi:oligopeptidase A